MKLLAPSVVTWFHTCSLSTSWQLNIKQLHPISDQRPLDEDHISHLLSSWGDSLSSIKNTSMDYALLVVESMVEGNLHYSCLSGQHRTQVLIRRIALGYKIDWASAASKAEAKWTCHIFSEGMSGLWG